ncbi:MAG: AtpZ/AtpI family protein [Acidimicrobiia bacterium]
MKKFTSLLGNGARTTNVPPVQPPVAVLPERNTATYPGEDRNRVERKYLQFAGVGVQFALTILLLTLAGIWVDGRLDTGPLFTVVLLLFGFAGATWSLIRQVLGPDKGGKKP